jgi:hypothetical protein
MVSHPQTPSLPIFLPHLVPHLFSCHRRRPSIMSSIESRSSSSPMSITSDPSHLGPGLIPLARINLPGPTSRSRSHSYSGSMSTTSDPTFHAAPLSHSSGAVSRDSRPISTTSEYSDSFHGQPPITSSDSDLPLLDALFDCGFQFTAQIYISCYEVRPRVVLEALSILATGTLHDRFNYVQLMIHLFREDQMTAAGIFSDLLRAGRPGEVSTT